MVEDWRHPLIFPNFSEISFLLFNIQRIRPFLSLEVLLQSYHFQAWLLYHTLPMLITQATIELTCNCMACPVFRHHSTAAPPSLTFIRLKSLMFAYKVKNYPVLPYLVAKGQSLNRALWASSTPMLDQFDSEASRLVSAPQWWTNLIWLPVTQSSLNSI